MTIRLLADLAEWIRATARTRTEAEQRARIHGVTVTWYGDGSFLLERDDCSYRVRPPPQGAQR